MPHASTILIGGRACDNSVGRHLEYGQGPRRAHCVVPRSAGRGLRERPNRCRHVDYGHGSRGLLSVAISSKGGRGGLIAEIRLTVSTAGLGTCNCARQRFKALFKNESVSDRRCSNASSFRVALSNLVTWAHTHGTICSQIPALENVQNVGHPSKENSVLWICGAGHAYLWQCGKLDIRSREENKAVKKRRWSVASEASSREANLGEKRFRTTPSFERAEADAVSTGSCSRSPGVTQQKDDTVYIIHSEPSPREKEKKSESMKSCFAAEQHLSMSGGEVKADRCKVKLESKEDLQIISDEEQCTSDEDNKGVGINQNVLSDSPVNGMTAKEDLQTHRSQKVAFNNPTATQTSGFAPTGKPPLPLPQFLTSLVSNPESLEGSVVRLGPLHPAGPVTEASRPRNPPGPAVPKEHLKSVPVSSIEAKAPLGSPASVTFFEFEAGVDVQPPFQLSPPDCGTPGMGLSGNVTENPAEE
ncbi:PREDICTED: uncharacterized protein KIAA1958-like, partial [Leptosomus discolor]|uniref:uncharacterized protein KIAA1958-like n=1 Tax=Leptosomus discolor TaxID=188344 RepID=UPI000522885F